MKTFFLSLFLFAVSGFFVVSPAQQARFDQATNQLEQNELREAIEMYKSIEEEGYKSGALWLNMGITYTYLDSLGIAKYYFLRAGQFTETKTRADEALVYVNERFNRRSAVLPRLPWNRFFESLSQNAGVTFLFVSAFFFLYAGIGAVLVSWFKKRIPPILKHSGTVSILISVVIFGSALYIDYLDNRYGTGVMIEQQITVHEQPHTESASVSTAYEGYTMQVDHHRSDQQAGWTYVRLENGMYGWLEEDNIMVF
ncbi:MAG: hypothetical protein WD604_00590 [Balneolaceae bacterium]